MNIELIRGPVLKALLLVSISIVLTACGAPSWKKPVPIDQDVDDTRQGLAGDLAYSQVLVKIAVVKGSQVSTMEDTHYNLTPDPYLSDGNRVALVFDERPATLDQIELLDWDSAHLDTIQIATSKRTW